MSGTVFAIFGAIGGGMITAASAVVISYYQRSSALRDAHRMRAAEKYMKSYERIFVTCRSTLDALNDYVSVEKQVSDRSDSFLYQLLEMLRDCAYQYCIAVDWRHNSGMAYLEMKLEEQCLHLRDLLLRWLSDPRVSYGDVAVIRRNGKMFDISIRDVHRLNIGDYQELIVERRLIVSGRASDTKLIAEIREAATSVIKELKGVMAY
jgi:hypothetical protein